MKFQIYIDEVGEFRWRLIARNGNIIAESGEGYKKKADLKRSIKSIQEKVSVAKTEDLEE